MTAQKAKRERHFYNPPIAIGPVPASVVYKQVDYRRDSYRGTKDDLVALGIMPANLFPGSPGMPATTVTIRPHAVQGWGLPGHVEIKRSHDEKFTLTIFVSMEERKRREAKHRESNDRAKAERELDQSFRDAQRLAGQSLTTIVEVLGREVVERRLRAQRPRRDASHLRLVWSAPTP